MRWDALKREAEILNRAAMRSDVITRAQGRCEVCRIPVPPGELHHVAGKDRRRRNEQLSTLLFCCTACHHALHRSDLDTLYLARSWANAHGFDEAKAAIMHRLEKLTEAKWASLRAPAGEGNA
jgi:5-methylcytosine-specific restriction endonuclease McrA